jgi:hypothetical protein
MPDAAPSRQLEVTRTPVIVQRPRTRPRPAQVVPTPAPTPTPTPTPVPVREDPTPVTVPERPSDTVAPARAPGPITGSLGVAGTAFAGLFPQIGGGVELEGGLERGLFRWQLGASGWFGGSFRAPMGAIGGDLWGLSGGTGVCVVPGLERVRFPICAVGGAGAITANSVNITPSSTAVRPWAYAGVDLRVEGRPRPW